VYEFLQNPFHLRHNIAFICKLHFVTYVWLYDVSGTAEVCHHWDGTSRESFKDDTATKVPNRWKNHHIGRTQPLQDLVMTDPTAKANILLYFKGSRKLLKAVPFRTIAEDGESSQTASQKRGSRAQRQIASFAWY
jgi:hypothetical protein